MKWAIIHISYYFTFYLAGEYLKLPSEVFIYKQLQCILSLHKINILLLIAGKIIKSVPGKLMKEVNN